MAIFIRDGLQLTAIDQSPLQPLDDSTEWCTARIFLTSSHPHASQGTASTNTALDVFNVYRPPIRASENDDRADHFAMDAFPTTSSTIITGDFNAHHSTWDRECGEPYRVGELLQAWSVEKEWVVLNSGAATRAGYGNGPPTTPDVTLAHRGLARRAAWDVGPDLGSDHLPQLITVTVNGSRPRRIRKTRWSFQKTDWTTFTENCETEFAEHPLDNTSTAGQMARRFVDTVMKVSVKHVLRGAQADPKPWALDPELAQAVAERREARITLHQSPTPENRERWKQPKKRAAEMEEEAKKKAFRKFASEELNRPANLGRIPKIFRKMEGGVQTFAPGQAVNGDRGREAVGDRSKADAFVATHAAVSKHTRNKKWDKKTKAEIKLHRRSRCSCGDARTWRCRCVRRHPRRRQQAHEKQEVGQEDEGRNQTPPPFPMLLRRCQNRRLSVLFTRGARGPAEEDEAEEGPRPGRSVCRTSPAPGPHRHGRTAPAHQPVLAGT